VKLQKLSPTARSGAVLLVLACVALLLVISLSQSSVGAAALSLFRSPPSSPVSAPAEPVTEPAEGASSQPQPSAAPTAGPAIPTWAIVIAAVLVVVLVVAFFLLRGRR
jgi:hypothetical protein